MSFKYMLCFSTLLMFLTSLASIQANEVIEKNVELDNIKINYHFLDQASMDK